ncbi:MAG: rubrerythrin [Bacteroidetes bacterium RIFOXYA12_FULL_35_11]|nr:MAG: rubrerythrin [Bacteroidetes bacterium GWF2_35_48]OFY79414.1 MAG: rubrerythrin [Bacteroidetes bacterium RIFOXYA12_FULL_35_11]OFY99103.1 MAG: rubrerythrin [Bacteroidetes bacterium RIFOXYC12_FULL_35_7]HBX53742.1 rubrerythrin [Bacteroidales bacterium]
MNEFNSIDDILDFAIENEQKAVDFYTTLAGVIKNSDMRDTFEQFAREEIGHKAKLVKIKEEKIFVASKENISDLKISDYVDNVEVSSDMSYQDALILAMKREKSAFKLYTKLATKTSNTDLQNLFLSLAQEESKHKLMFEVEYDDVIFREN